MNPDEYLRMFEVEDSHWWYVGLHELLCGIVAGAEASGGGRPRILDAGCGTGRLAQLLSGLGEVEACDRSRTAVDLTRRRGIASVAHGDLATIPLPDGRYDVVTCIDVLYHRGVPDDAAVMGRLLRALVPGGRLIVQVPAFELLRSTHDDAVHSRERYRKSTLVSRLAEAGFTVEYAGYRLFLLFPLVAAYRVARRIASRTGTAAGPSDVRPVPGPANRLLLALVRAENRLIRLGVRFPVGLSVFAVARRPPLPGEPAA